MTDLNALGQILYTHYLVQFLDFQLEINCENDKIIFVNESINCNYTFYTSFKLNFTYEVLQSSFLTKLTLFRCMRIFLSHSLSSSSLCPLGLKLLLTSGLKSLDTFLTLSILL